MEEKDYHLLHKGKKLNNRYIIEDILGEGGFGITYVGRDEILGVKVAIKEYYPKGVVTRNNTVGDVVSISYAEQKDIFHKGKARFLSEARMLAQFNDQEGIVDVTDFFEDNNTAYIVMEYLDGITLKDYLKQYGVLDVLDMLALIAPMLESLYEVHQHGLIHRDISPDNIMILQHGKVKLMDFGAARDYTDFGDKSLSIVLKPGFAPEEQYRSRGVQGPWTDIYAMSATIYKCITGARPEEALQRVIDDTLKPPSEYGVPIPAGTERALMKGLAVFQKDRYQDLREFCHDLYSDIENQDTQLTTNTSRQSHKPTTDTAAKDPASRNVSQAALKGSAASKKSGEISKMLHHPGDICLPAQKKKQIAIGAGAVAALVILMLIIFNMAGGGGSKTESSSGNGLPDVPTERQMVTDFKNNSSINGKILDVTVIDDDINHTEGIYHAECKVESQAQGGSGITAQYEITYKLENDAWVFESCEKSD